MFIDTFINIFCILSMLIIYMGIIVFFKDESIIEMKIFLYVKKWSKCVLYLSLSVIVFLASIFKIHYLGTAILIGLFSTCLLAYSFIDVLYLQEKNKEYIRVLQKEFCTEKNFNHLFKTVTYSRASYKVEYETRRNKYGIVHSEKYGLCIGNDSEKILYIPKKYMSKKELIFYCKCIELDKNSMPIFKNKTIIEKFATDYDFSRSTYIYRKIFPKEKKIAEVIFASLTIIFILIVLIIGIGSCINPEFLDFLILEIN